MPRPPSPGPRRLRLTSFRTDPEPGGSAVTRCPNCPRTALDWHQPEADRPDRLLATCRRCRTWYVCAARADSVTVLPDPDRKAKPPAALRRRESRPSHRA